MIQNFTVWIDKIQQQAMPGRTKGRLQRRIHEGVRLRKITFQKIKKDKAFRGKLYRLEACEVIYFGRGLSERRRSLFGVWALQPLTTEVLGSNWNTWIAGLFIVAFLFFGITLVKLSLVIGECVHFQVFNSVATTTTLLKVSFAGRMAIVNFHLWPRRRDRNPWMFLKGSHCLVVFVHCVVLACEGRIGTIESSGTHEESCDSSLACITASPTFWTWDFSSCVYRIKSRLPWHNAHEILTVRSEEIFLVFQVFWRG